MSTNIIVAQNCLFLVHAVCVLCNIIPDQLKAGTADFLVALALDQTNSHS